jgi:uncharacterized protein
VNATRGERPVPPPDDDGLRALLRAWRTIAVVGLSSKPWRDSHRVAGYLQGAGYRIVPINPNEEEVLGERSYPSLLDAPDPIDLVDVFRRTEHAPELARQAVQVGAKGLWLQVGIVSEEAARIAEAGGLSVIMGVCLMTEHRRLQP